MPALRRFLLLAALLMLGGTTAPAAASDVLMLYTSPAVTKVTPDHGPAAGGYEVVVEVRNTSGTVRFGGKPAEVVSSARRVHLGEGGGSVYWNEYTVVVPPGQAGATARVDVADGDASTPLNFVYDNAPPAEPLAWQCGPTFILKNMDPPNFPEISGVPVQTRTIDRQTISVTAPIPFPSTGPDHLVNMAGGRTVLGAYRDGCYSALPRDYEDLDGISGTVPAEAQGGVGGGNRVTVRVRGGSSVLNAAAQLRFGGIPGANPSAVKSDIVCGINSFYCREGVDYWFVSADAPPGAAGSVDLSVMSSGQEYWGQTAASNDYRYLAPPPPPAPVISGHGGGPGYAAVGGLIIVRGTNLGGLRSIKVGGRAALRLSATPTLVVAFAPPLAKGAYPVTVTTTAGTATAPVKYVYRSLF